MENYPTIVNGNVPGKQRSADGIYSYFNFSSGVHWFYPIHTVGKLRLVLGGVQSISV